MPFLGCSLVIASKAYVLEPPDRLISDPACVQLRGSTFSAGCALDPPGSSLL